MASFKLREPKGNKETTIFFTMAFRKENKTLQYPTGVKIHPDDWDFESKRPKRKVKHTSKIKVSHVRKRLNTIEDFAEQEYQRYKLLNEQLTMVAMREKLNVKLEKAVESSNDFFKIYKEFLEHKKYDNKGEPVAESTYMRYVYNKRLLQEFQAERKNEIKLKNVDSDFYNEFLNFCIITKKHSANTLRRNVGLFKTFLRWCHENGKTYNTEFLKFKSPQKQPTMEIALNKEQLIDLNKADLSHIPHLERVKDIFVFGCLTGQRFSNYKNITKTDIVSDSILVPDCKDPSKVLTIPLLLPARKILEKYDYSLPTISNQKFNKYIKHVFEKLGYTSNTKRIRRIGREPIEEVIPFYKRISSHTARRSFITIMLNEGIPAKTIMAITGHKSVTQFLEYYKPSEDYTKESMNTVFGNI